MPMCIRSIGSKHTHSSLTVNILGYKVIWLNYNVNIPAHTPLSSIYPSLHAHVKLPSVFVHVENSVQLSVPSVHSSRSWEQSTPSQPVLHKQPMALLHSAVLAVRHAHVSLHWTPQDPVEQAVNVTSIPWLDTCLLQFVYITYIDRLIDYGIV